MVVPKGKFNSGDEEYSKDKSKQVEVELKRMHTEAKNQRYVKDADLDSINTPIYEIEQGISKLKFKF